MTELPLIRLQPGREKRVASGHPWIFSNEIVQGPHLREIEIGAPVVVEDHRGKALGIFAFNRHALIAGRRLGAAGEGIDQAFLERRLAQALALRKRLFERPFYRLVHAEADGLPGLVVDRYGDVVAVQPNAAWIDRLSTELVEALRAVVDPRVVVLRAESGARTLEGLSPRSEVPLGALDGPVPVEENGLHFLADLEGGQKTGWFYDQRDNRAFAARFANGEPVLDVYSHTGGFALTAAAAGAKRVIAVDRSEHALALAARAAELNGLSHRVSTVKAEAFAELERRGAGGERYGLVIVDPPAFVKTRKDLASGSRGYVKLTRLAAPLVRPGGALVVSSCSHHVDPAAFTDLVARGLSEAGRTGRIVRAAGAGPDHPVHPLLPESGYLKALFLILD